MADKMKNLGRLFTKEGARKRYALEQKREDLPDEDQIRREREESYERRNPNFEAKKSALEKMIEENNKEIRDKKKKDKKSLLDKLLG